LDIKRGTVLEDVDGVVVRHDYCRYAGKNLELRSCC
jgi:hypothetical protein